MRPIICSTVVFRWAMGAGRELVGMLAYALVGNGARTYRGGRWDGVVIKYIAESEVPKHGGGLEIEWQTIGLVMICK